MVVALVGAERFLAPFDAAFDQRVGEVLGGFERFLTTFEDFEQRRFGESFREFKCDAELGGQPNRLFEVVTAPDIGTSSPACAAYTVTVLTPIFVSGLQVGAAKKPEPGIASVVPNSASEHCGTAVGAVASPGATSVLM